MSAAAQVILLGINDETYHAIISLPSWILHRKISCNLFRPGYLFEVNQSRSPDIYCRPLLIIPNQYKALRHGDAENVWATPLIRGNEKRKGRKGVGPMQVVDIKTTSCHK